MKTNKNGVKLLSIVMVFAMAFAGVALLVPSEDIDATAEETTNVAKIGDFEYPTLEAAVAAVKTGETITLISDVETTSTLSFTTEGEYTLNIGNHTVVQKGTGYMVTVGGSNPPSYPFDTINDGVQLTILGDGNIQSVSTTFRSYGKIIFGANGIGPTVEMENEAATHSIFKVEEGSYLTINGGEFTVGGAVERVMQSFGTTVINDGTFNGDIELWKYREYISTITIDPEVVINGQCSSYPYDESTSFTEKDGFIGLDVKIGADWFTTLEDAATKAVSGDVVEILASTTVNDEVEFVPGVKILVKDGVTLTVNETITLSKGTTIDMNAGSQIKGTINGPNNNTLVGSFKAGEDVEITGGSLIIGGTIVEGDGEYSGITVSGDGIKISGTLDSGVTILVTEGTSVSLEGALVINDGATFTIETGATVNLGDKSISLAEGSEMIVMGDVESTTGTISGTGTIYAATPDAIADSIDSTTTPEIKNASEYSGVEVSTYEEFIANLGNPVVIVKEDIVIPAGDTVTLPKTLILNLEAEIIVEGELQINGSTIRDIKDGAIVMGSEDAILTMNSADVCVDIDNTYNGYISVSNPKSMEVKGEATSDLYVGYGNTLVISDLTIPNGKSVHVYGTVKVQGTVTLSSGASFNVYASGDAEIEGKLNVNGTVNTDGKFNILSAVTVYNDSGKAYFNANKGTVTVKSGAEFTVTKVRQSGITATNDLNITDADFIVEGKLTVTGSLKGTVLDKGEVVFNGTSVGAEIVIYDGISVTIASVTGTITITDSGIADDDAKTDGVLNSKTTVYDGNKVELKDVKGITVSAKLSYASKTISEVAYKVYTSKLTVSGTAVAVDETLNDGVLATPATVSITNGTAKFATDVPEAVKEKTQFMGSIVIEDVTLAKYVQLTLTGSYINVNGIITSVSEKSNVTIASGKVVVSGSVIVGPKATDLVGEGYIQAVKYEVQDAEANFTTYYTTFAAAIEASSTAYEGKLTVYGTISVENDMNVPKDITVILANGAKLSVSKEATLDIASGALLDGTNGTIAVSATLVIEDKNTGLKYNSASNKFTYQVYTENGDVATYTGIVGALKNAASGDVITLKQGATVDSNITVADGVKLIVPNGVELKIGSSTKDITATVDGIIEIQKGGKITKTAGSYKTIFVIDGVVSDAGNGITFSTDGTVNIIADDYVDFTKKVDGKEVKFYSNLTYAAENAINGTIAVTGNVSAGDIVLTKDKNADNLILSIGNDASVNVTSIKLVGAEIVMTYTGNGSVVDAKLTGTVTATIDGGDAEVKLNGTNISNIASTTDADEKTHLVIAGTVHGKITIASGIVDVKADSTVTAGTAKTDVLTIASGATLNVPAGTTITGTGNDLTLVIDGTLYVDNGTATIANADISGEVKIEGTNTTISDSVITGTIIALEKDDANSVVAGIIKIGTGVSLGDKPSELGTTGSIVGKVSLGTTYLVVYPGTDLSAAKIEWNDVTEESDALVTEFYVNGSLYMTVYDKSSGKTVQNIANTEEIDLAGLVTPANTKWFSAEDLKKDVSSSSVGEYEKVYTVLEVADVKGTISAGVGLQIYLNGVSVDNYFVYGEGYLIPVGTYKVSIEVQNGYDGSKATITFNGSTVSNNGTIVFSEDGFVLTANGAVPAVTPTPTPTPIQPSEKDDSMGITEYLLIVLVILAAILVVVVAIRMMRS